MEYKASFDTMTKVMSVGVIALLAFVCLRCVREILAAQGDKTTVLIQSGIIIFLVAAIVFSYLFSVDKYLIEDNQLVIKRPIGDKRYSLRDIVEVRAIEKGEMAGTIRTFGNGGLFGYYGKFSNSTFGSMTWYTTQRANKVFIRTINGDKIVITPDDLSLVDRLKGGMSKIE
ncbi:MAG: PH domain-containing protein [Saprospiraceae bacterium]